MNTRISLADTRSSLKMKAMEIEELHSEISFTALRNIIQTMPGHLYWKDVHGVYRGCNDNQAKNLGMNHGNEVIGRTDFELSWPKHSAEQFRENDKMIMQERKTVIFEEVSMINGKESVVLSHKAPLINGKGKVEGVLGISIDISKQKEAEKQLLEEKKKVEQSDQLKTAFIQNMEHDIRTPFSGVLGMAQYLWEAENDPIKKGCLNDIVQCAQELLDYCNSILDFSRIEFGAHLVSDKKFYLQNIVNSAIKMELPATKLKKLNLVLDYDAEIPVVLVGDSYRVHRILVNLLSNAIKFTQYGQVKLTVALLSKSPPSTLVRFTVEDTGVGIPEEKKAFIFEKFSRLSQSNKGFYKGLGLGLRIVKQFMHEINGEIDLISEVGRGTKFICTIPFQRPLTNDFVDANLSGSESLIKN